MPEERNGEGLLLILKDVFVGLCHFEILSRMFFEIEGFSLSRFMSDCKKEFWFPSHVFL